MPKKKETQEQQSIVPISEQIEDRILMIRGQKVMLDEDLAAVYGVTTKRLNEQIKRNLDRFPQDFIFQLTQEEMSLVRSQIATASKRNFRYLPYAFTEHGAVMVATILNSSIAVQASIHIVRAFIKMRSILVAHKELAKKLEELEKKHDTQAKKTDNQYKAIVEVIKRIINDEHLKTKELLKQQIGFITKDEQDKGKKN